MIPTSSSHWLVPHIQLRGDPAINVQHLSADASSSRRGRERHYRSSQQSGLSRSDVERNSPQSAQTYRKQRRQTETRRVSLSCLSPCPCPSGRPVPSVMASCCVLPLPIPSSCRSPTHPFHQFQVLIAGEANWFSKPISRASPWSREYYEWYASPSDTLRQTHWHQRIAGRPQQRHR